MSTVQVSIGGNSYNAEQGASGITPHSVPEIAGLPVSATNPLPTTAAGGTGTDWSINPVAIPLAGYASTPIRTVPVNAARNSVEVFNLSADVIQVVIDDGLGNNQTSFLLAGAAATPGQGGSWKSGDHKGRVRLFAPTANIATDPVSVSEH